MTSHAQPERGYDEKELAESFYAFSKRGDGWFPTNSKYLGILDKKKKKKCAHQSTKTQVESRSITMTPTAYVLRLKALVVYTQITSCCNKIHTKFD